MPVTQNGAGTGKVMLDNSGTAPVFSTQVYKYWITADGSSIIRVYLNGDGGADGAGAVSALLVLPYVSSDTLSGNNPVYSNTFKGIAGGGSELFMQLQVLVSTSTAQIFYQNTVTDTEALTNANFSAATRQVLGEMFYKAFGSAAA
jgi:hypothetical protein